MLGTSIRLRRVFPAERPRVFAVPARPLRVDGAHRRARGGGPGRGRAQSAGVDLLIVPKGAVREIAPVLLPRTLLGVHLSASTTLGGAPDHKVLVGSASEAVGLGADLVSIQVNFGIPEEGAMLRDLGTAVDQCRSLGLPLLCMTYVKSPGEGLPRRSVTPAERPPTSAPIS